MTRTTPRWALLGILILISGCQSVFSYEKSGTDATAEYDSLIGHRVWSDVYTQYVNQIAPDHKLVFKGDTLTVYDADNYYAFRGTWKARRYAAGEYTYDTTGYLNEKDFVMLSLYSLSDPEEVLLEGPLFLEDYQPKCLRWWYPTRQEYEPGLYLESGVCYVNNGPSF